MSDPTEPHDCHDGQLIEMLAADNRRLRLAGCALAEAALHVIREYDGLHRLALAVSEWAKAVADEGGRGERVDLMRDLRIWFGDLPPPPEAPLPACDLCDGTGWLTDPDQIEAENYEAASNPCHQCNEDG